jgi:hypothetical protein
MSVAERDRKKSLARNLGEFFGHILRGAKTKVDDKGNEVVRTEIKRTVEEDDRGDMVLRRTTIDEVELRKRAEPPGS